MSGPYFVCHVQYWTKKWDITFFYIFSTTIDSSTTSDASKCVKTRHKRSCILKRRNFQWSKSYDAKRKVSFAARKIRIFNFRGKIRFFADISIDLTRERLKSSTRVAVLDSVIQHIVCINLKLLELRHC